MADFPNQVEKVIREGYSFDLGGYIGRGFEIFKKNIGLFIAFIVVYVLLTVGLSFVPIVGQLASSLIVGPCLVAGFYITARKTDDNQPTEFNDFFKGFDFLSQLLVMSLIQILIFIVAAIPFIALLLTSGILEGNEPSGGFFFIALLAVIPFIYLGVAWSFAPMLIVFYEMKAWPALEASRKIISQKWFSFFGFQIVLGLIVMAGILALVVGMLAAIPTVMCAIFAAFRDIVGMPNDGEQDVLDHLITEF